MRRFAWASLRTRLLVLVGLAVVPSLGLMLYTDAEQRQQAASDVQANALRLTRLASANQERVIEGAHQLLLALAQFPEKLTGDPAQCTALMAEILKAQPFYANLGTVAPDGRWVCSAEPLQRPVNESDQAWFKRALQTGSFTIGDYQVSQVGTLAGKATVNFAYPVYGGNGQLQAFVVATLDLAWLNQLAAQLQLPAGTTLTMVDERGTILTRHPDAARWVGQSVPEAPVIKDVLARQVEGVDETSGLDGVPRLFAFAPLRDDGQNERAYIVLGIPAQTAFADADRGLFRNLAGAGLVSILALAAAWIGSETFVLRPVRVLLNATRQIAQGDLSPRASLSGGSGELGRLAHAFDKMTEALEQKSQENARLLEEVQRLANTDSLTGLYNRRAFFGLAGREFARARRFHTPLSAVMLDVDHFKAINDTQGHAVGDQVLQVVAQRCAQNIREIDILGRYGGDEFVLVLPGTDRAEAYQLAERLRQCVVGVVEIGSSALTLTVSLGVASLTETMPNIANLLEHADAALYRAKEVGRNRIDGGLDPPPEAPG
jgi:diguanylate cyclase (GGDEF)-like protein